MYANIDEAWNTTSIFPEYNNNYESDMMGQPIEENNDIQEHFENSNGCDYYLEHFRNCSKCYNKLINNSNNNNFLSNDMKEIIIIILIGIIIIFIIDLFVKLIKKN